MERKIKSLSIALTLVLAIPVGAGAMHIMEGFLPPQWCVVWGVLCLPFLVFGFFSIKKRVSASSKNLLLLAMCGAFAFVLSALKLPSVTGSCSHPTGVGLGAILFGPASMSLVGAVILLFQALLLAHGGLTTLGANLFSMAVVGPFVAYGAYALLKKLKVNISVCVFAAAFLGDVLTYVVTSFQLAAAFPDSGGGLMGSLLKFLAVFAVTQLPIAVSEGLLTVVVYNGLKKYSSNEITALEAMGSR